MKLIIVENYIAPELLKDYRYHLWVSDMTRTFEQTFIQSHTIYPDGEQSVAKAWNKGIERAKELGCDYVAVLNLDTILDEECLNQMVDVGEVEQELVLWSANDCLNRDLSMNHAGGGLANQPNFSCFMVRSNFLEVTKGFDENFAPYGDDDWDMQTRLEAKGQKYCRLLFAHFFHFGSQTLATDKEFSKVNSPTHNRDYFIKKWGAEPGHWGENAYFKHPFNDPSKDAHDWSKL